nr:hypothetical protein [Rickettsiaceae bacterium]
SITTLEAENLSKLSIDSIKELQRLDEFILPEDAKMKLQELKPLIEKVRQRKEDERNGVLLEPVLLDEDVVLKRRISVAERMKKNSPITSQDDGSGTPSISPKKGFGQTKGGAHEI